MAEVLTIKRRTRLSPEESRSAALDAARLLLIDAGPQAVTLKAVGAKIGRTHANLLHHFGSASELQKALAAHISARITGIIADTVAQFYKGQTAEETARQITNLTFDAFDQEGAGALATWMIQSGEKDSLAPIVEAITDLVTDLYSVKPKDSGLSAITLKLVLLALGDSMIGAQLSGSLGLPRDIAREMGTALLIRHFQEIKIPEHSASTAD
jgi:AcrR family transcriptional regulator